MIFLQKFKEWVIYILARYRNVMPIFLLAKFARIYLKGCANYSYNFELNGEAELLRKLSGLPLPVIFDVGANHGEWSQIVANQFPHSHIHCFELAPPTAAILRKNLSGNEQIHINEFGLSDVTGDVSFNYAKGHDGHSTLLQTPAGEGQFELLKSRVMTGDKYIEQVGIEKIDFLKIDVEGLEHAVLKGFQHTLKRGLIHIIQFEYGRANIVSNFLLRDFYNYFEQLNYKIGKIYPEGVEFKKYEFSDEDFIGPNFIAVHRDFVLGLQTLS